MHFIVVALDIEAKPIVDRLFLKQVEDDFFKIFKNQDTILIVSGMGNIASSVATTYLLTKFQAKQSDSIVNLGLAGANFSCNIGDVFLVSKVIDYQTRSILTLPYKAKKLVSFSKPVSSCDIKNVLVDMEGYGFLKAAKIFIDNKNIKIKKVVSDFLDPSYKKAGEVYKLIEKML